jgi:hypothetical protein
MNNDLDAGYEANSLRSRFLKTASSPVFPCVLLVIAGIGLAVAFTLFPLDVALNSLIYLIPIIVASIFLFIKNNEQGLDIRGYIENIPFQHLLLTTVLFFMISLAILNTGLTRPFAYFISIGLISSLIFIQIICRRPAWTDYLILTEIVALSLNLLWGVVLKYPLYFGSTDILGYLSNIEQILKTSDISTLGLNYQNFPLFHIFNAMASQITGLSSANTLFIFMGIAWQFGILFFFLIFRKLLNSSRFALIACLLFAFNAEEIYYGAYEVTRSLAFVILMGWLYLILDTSKTKYLILSILMMWALILTHHATELFAIPLLIFVCVCQMLIDRPASRRIPLFPVIILFVCFYFYVFYIAAPMTSALIPAWLSTILESEATGTISSITQKASLGPMQIGYYAFVIFFSLLGIGIAFRAGKAADKFAGFGGIALASLFFLLFYVPGITDLIPQSRTALLYRIPLLASPFILLVVAFGVLYFMNFELKIWRFISKNAQLPILTIMIVGTSIFFSTISGANGADYPYFVYPSVASSEYFTDSELESFSFMEENGNSALALFADYETTRDDYNLSNFDLRPILKSGDTSYITSDSYVVIRAGELLRRGSLNFSIDGSYRNLYRYYSTLPDLVSSQSYANNIYSNNSVYIYQVNND